ncbi:MAG TPA: hypothetical protein VGA42_04155 [Gemmatimonadales bacterium]
MNPDFRDMLSTLSAEGAEYLVVGAYALAAHGLPRATNDLDIRVGRTGDNPSRVFQALAPFGAPLERVSLDDLRKPDTVLQVGVKPWRIDILTAIDGVGFEEAWPARITVAIDQGLEVPVLSREHLIQNKRAVGRPQDLADVARLEGNR